ncbi:phage head-tail connector protein, partial [Bacillus sp. UNC41MFS5]|uniref:phage head-tail connector protein n=1 Tax=Bacillus sp. UNC41MFS5 TaxID=1449046 RepID=UPI000478B066
MADITIIKTILGLSDTSKDVILNALYTNIESAVKLYINSDTAPAELVWVINEATIARYNRVGSEGLTQENIDVIGLTYQADVLDVYKPYLDAYIVKVGTSNSPRLRM